MKGLYIGGLTADSYLSCLLFISKLCISSKPMETLGSCSGFCQSYQGNMQVGVPGYNVRCTINVIYNH